MQNQISEVDLDPVVMTLKKELRFLRRNLNASRTEQGRIEELFAAIAGNVSDLPKVNSLYKPPKKGKKSKKSISECWHFTDWHIGEVTEASEIEGFNKYNLKTARKRISNFVEATLAWTMLHRNSYVVDTLNVLVTGDMISGDIHEELKTTNEFPVPVQVARAGEILSDAVALAAPHFKTVNVEFLCSGNHDRLSVKYQFKESGYNSYTYLVGYIAQQRLFNFKNVKFSLHPVMEKIINIEGYSYLMIHGHTIKGWAGVPFSGIDRKVGKEARARFNMAKVKRFDKMILGHFHTPINGNDFMMTGSLSGTNEYDHAAGRYSRPTQSAWFVHPKHGEFDWTPFYLEDK